MSQRDVMGFQTISNVLFFDFEGNMSNIDVEISWKLSFIPLNSGGLYDISKPNISLIYILNLQFVFYFFYQRISLPFFCICILTSFLVVPFYSCINFPRFFNSFLTKQFKHGSLCGLLHAQLKLFCSCFKNHDDTDFWWKLSGDVEV